MRFVVFVEGTDDVVFWNAVFVECGVESYHLKRAGGAEELSKYCDAILSNDADIVVARDSDHSEFGATRQQHTRILYTYGYAIENSICNVRGVGQVSRALAHSTDDLEPQVAAWLTAVEAAVEPLVFADVAARLRGAPGRIPLTNCREFLAGRACEMSRDKCEMAVRAVRKMLPRADLEAARAAVLASGKPLRAHIRGHFVMSAVSVVMHHLAKMGRGRAVAIPNDVLFALLIGAFSLQMAPADEGLYVRTAVEALKGAA